MSAPEDFDIIVIGAGLTGINTAYRLQTALPWAKFIILESRAVLGGTWAFWRYPGVRSDSSLAVFGLPWHPWPHDSEFASAADIHAYLGAAARAHGIDARIRFGHRVLASSWSSAEQRWRLRVRVPGGADGGGGGEREFTAGWVISCAGYYDYDRARPADIPGIERFAGQAVHPQFWPEDLVYAGKRIVVVGSGATTVTLLPALAEQAAHVTMLQRSPSYVFSPSGRNRNAMALFLKRWLPARLASRIDRWRRLCIEGVFVQLLLRFPNRGRRILRKATKAALPVDFPVDVHFTPRYSPFEQRLCLCPDRDFFKALQRDNCEIVTDTIETVTSTGITLSSGKELDADMIITATGLYLDMIGAYSVTVDGKPVNLAEKYFWRSCMLDDIPNASLIVGYIAGTWTPGADIRIKTLIAVIKQARKIGATSVRPKLDEKLRAQLPRLSTFPNSSTYIVEARGRMPLSSGRDPWVAGKSWFYDTWCYFSGSVKTGMEYTIPRKAKKF